MSIWVLIKINAALTCAWQKGVAKRGAGVLALLRKIVLMVVVMASMIAVSAVMPHVAQAQPAQVSAVGIAHDASVQNASDRCNETGGCCVTTHCAFCAVALPDAAHHFARHRLSESLLPGAETIGHGRDVSPKKSPPRSV